MVVYGTSCEVPGNTQSQASLAVLRCGCRYALGDPGRAAQMRQRLAVVAACVGSGRSVPPGIRGRHVKGMSSTPLLLTRVPPSPSTRGAATLLAAGEPVCAEDGACSSCSAPRPFAVKDDIAGSPAEGYVPHRVERGGVRASSSNRRSRPPRAEVSQFSPSAARSARYSPDARPYLADLESARWCAPKAECRLFLHGVDDESALGTGRIGRRRRRRRTSSPPG